MGRYTILRPLAKGGMAELLLARTEGVGGFERHVVIKQIRPEQAKDKAFVAMFLTEARLAASLHHANIIQVQDIGEADGVPYFAMEYVHGEDVRHFLRVHHEAGVQVPIQHVLTIAIGVAAALHHAHEQRGPDRKPLDLVHRDVTPGNILVGYDGNVKLVDFGIAKAITPNAVVTEVGLLKGKAPYMSPEQCSGKQADRRSDLFSLGIVLYELATVRRLFKGATEFLTMSAIVQGRIPAPKKYRPDLPAELEAIILKALARDREDRYQTAEQLRFDLDVLARSYGGASTTALNVYMKERFGERPEPWLVDPELETTVVDFDGSASGLASAPDDAVDHALPAGPVLGAHAPIVRARNKSITSQNEKSPPPSDSTGELQISDTVVEPMVESVVETIARPTEPTRIVSPLPRPLVEPDSRVDLMPRVAPRRRQLAIFGAIAALVITVPIVVATQGGRASTDQPIVPPPHTEVISPPSTPVVVVTPPDAGPAIAPDATELAVAPTEDAAPIARPVKLPAKKPPKGPPPTSRYEKPPATWDPNALFLKKKPK